MAKMRPILPASARAQRVTGDQHAAEHDGDDDSGIIAVSERDLDAGSSENDDASESNDARGSTGPARRKLLWPDELLDAMLCMRFTDPGIISAIEGATSNGQKAAAWRHFAAVLSGMGSTRVTERQLRLKFAKIKWEYKRWYETEHTEEERRAMGRPPSYMPILRRWFGAQHRGESRANSADVVTRSHQASDTSSVASAAPVPPRLEEALRERIRRQMPSADPQEQTDEAPSRHGPRPEPQAPLVPRVEPLLGADGVTLLAQEAGRGMTAIADALKSRSPDSEVAALLQAHHVEQMAMMRALLDAQRAQNELLERIAASLANK